MQTTSTRLHAAHDIVGTVTFPWQRCALSGLVEKCGDLVREIADALPRGEYRLRDHIRRSLLNLRRRVALAAGEHEGSRYLALVAQGLRDAQELSLWIWESKKRNLGPPHAASHAWDVLRRVFELLRAKHTGTLGPYDARVEAQPATPLVQDDATPPTPRSGTVNSAPSRGVHAVAETIEAGPETHRSPSSPSSHHDGAAPHGRDEVAPPDVVKRRGHDHLPTPSTVPSPAPPWHPKRRQGTPRARRPPLDVRVAVL